MEGGFPFPGESGGTRLSPGRVARSPHSQGVTHPIGTLEATLSYPHFKTIQKVAADHGLNPILVAAVCRVESNFDTWAMRFEPGWRWWITPARWARLVGVSRRTEEVAQACSWGLMQVMGATARSMHGFASDLPRLCIPEVGLDVGCRHLALLIKRHGTIQRALSAYNTGRPQTRQGAYYTEKVLAAMDALKSCPHPGEKEPPAV
jgi:soluble lytic murein transglycosylase-like protein